MALSLQDQFDVAVKSWQTGDFDLGARILTDPESTTLAEQRTFAEQLGLKGGFLKAAVNIVADPTVWIALLLSRKFPTSQYLKGTIPHRLIGSANEFSGISSAARTVEGFFRGTNIPKLTNLYMRRKAEVLQVGNKIFDKLAVRPNWQEEMPVVSLILEGRNPAGATPELHKLAGDVRSHMNELWGFLSKTQKVRGGFDSPDGITRATAAPFPPGEAPRYLRDYLPHIPLLGTESLIEMSGKEAIAKMGKSKLAQAMQLMGQNPGRVWSVTASDRLTSNFEQYQTFMERVGARVFNPRLFQRKRMGVALQSAEGEGLFVTDLNVILQKYIYGVAQTHALNAPLSNIERSIARTVIEGADGKLRTIRPTSEPIAVQVINEGLQAAGPVKLIRRPIAGTNKFEDLVDPAGLNMPTVGALRTMVRDLRGSKGQDEILWGNLMNSIRKKSSDAFRTVMRKPQMDRVEDAIATIERGYKDKKLSSQITSYFYASTLGLNASSTFKNLLQPFLTTIPAMGVGPTLAGYKVLKQRIPRYASEFRNQHRMLQANRNLGVVPRFNLAQERAFERTFPELAANGIKADPRAFDLKETDLIADRVTGRPKFRNADAYSKFLLQPFTHAELSNQVVTFFGGREAMKQALRRGEVEIPRRIGGAPIAGAEIDDFLNLEAAALVNATQFRPGPGSRSPLQSMVPAPFRMFTSFPIRLINFFAESTARGALTEAQLRNAGLFERLTGGRNLGTLARSYAIGRTLTTGMRDALGVDIADAIGVTGPFTGVVQSGRLFAPLPIAPLPSVVFGLASYATTRDVKELQPLTLPLLGDVPFPKVLFPGGIQLSRTVQALRSYRPDLGGFVDEDERLMYRGDTTDAILGILGIPLDKKRRLREQMDRVQATRLRVRRYRRKYAVAARNYDQKEMTSLEAEFQDEYPDLGGLGITRHDLRRYNEQARLTAMQRMIRSLGSRMRYLERDIYTHDPDLIAGAPGGL